MTFSFLYNERLGIELPSLESLWEEYPKNVQEMILARWETIRGTIPDRIFSIEKVINQKQEELACEEDFDRSCLLNTEIAELASIINDLWLWYRIDQNLSLKFHQ
ncbi:hypothetical protein WD019_04035 [Fictibacillus sp. Mic-4]|uniref:hypothetical protein n=1 Tax=Fictibacillus TaxID=1329200 RepID=UPI000403AF4F|nr:hypothetical protein [Fictibacillus gelatini]